MKFLICALSMLVTGCIASNIITEYENLQQGGNFTELDMLQCQLRANGNTNVCAVRVSLVRCELLSLAWCYSPVFESGYSYSGKKTVSHTPPYTFYHYSAYMSWEIWETIPIAVLPGLELRIVLTAPTGTWSKIMLFLRNTAEQIVTHKYLWPSDISSGVKSSIVATFATSQINLEVEGQTHILTGAIADIRIFQFVFFDIQGEIHLVSYRAAPR